MRCQFLHCIHGKESTKELSKVLELLELPEQVLDVVVGRCWKFWFQLPIVNGEIIDTVYKGYGFNVH